MRDKERKESSGFHSATNEVVMLTFQIYKIPTANTSVGGHQEPEFVDAVQNITVPVGRDVKFSCHVRHLGTSYKVRPLTC